MSVYFVVNYRDSVAFDGRTVPRVKIGFTVRPTRDRLGELKSKFGRSALLLEEVGGTRDVEKYLHAHFADYALGHEWFRYEGCVKALCDRIRHERFAKNADGWRGIKPEVCCGREFCLGCGDVDPFMRSAIDGRWIGHLFRK